MSQDLPKDAFIASAAELTEAIIAGFGDEYPEFKTLNRNQVAAMLQVLEKFKAVQKVADPPRAQGARGLPSPHYQIPQTIQLVIYLNQEHIDAAKKRLQEHAETNKKAKEPKERKPRESKKKDLLTGSKISGPLF